VGADRTGDTAGQARWASARGERPRSSECDLLCALDGLPVAGVAEGSASEEHRAFLLHAVGLGRHVGAHSSRALCRDPRARRTRGEPDGCDHRQPERQGCSKGGCALDPQGFDAGKKITGRKRHILVDTLGLLLNVVVHPADVQDRDAARLVLDRRTRSLFPFITRIFADAGYQGPHAAQAAARTGRWVFEIVSATHCTNSSSCPSAGSSNELWHGSAAIVAWRAISSATPALSLPSSG